jgi:hypothetical protein
MRASFNKKKLQASNDQRALNTAILDDAPRDLEEAVVEPV